MSTIKLIESLQNPALYDHTVTNFKVLETHISWVILTGKFGYKIKKPLDFEVLDFSTLAKRRFYCEEEIRLNKLLAPALYVEVIAITGSEAAPEFNGGGEVIEYAIKMHEFSQQQLFTALLTQHTLTPALIDKLAKVIADFHLQAEVAPVDSVYGTPEHAHFSVKQNFTQILPWLKGPADEAILTTLQNWAENQYQQHYELLVQRKQQGFIRDCHGDLHLGNIILQQEQPVLFDRIEFNPDLRWIDVVADIAFLAMDLHDQHQTVLAHRLINTYLSYTGDYAGLALLPYYMAYRAMVRAKVALFHLTQPGLTAAQQQTIQTTYNNFIQLAERFAQVKPAALFITHGLSGSGKSTVARAIVEELGAIQINSDVERKRLFKLPLAARTRTALNQGIYLPEVTAKTYENLLQLASLIIKAGFPVIVDATFLQKEFRNQFAQLAKEKQIPLVILHCQVAKEIIEQWLEQRSNNKQEPSEADLTVLKMQETSLATLDAEEKQYTLTINTSSFTHAALFKDIAKMLYKDIN